MKVLVGVRSGVSGGESADGLYRPGNDLLLALDSMAGRSGGEEDIYPNMEYSEEEVVNGSNREEKGWEKVGKGGRKINERKRKKQEENSLEGSENESQEGMSGRKKTEMYNVVIRFEGEEGVKRMDPLKMTKIIKTQVGEIKYARVLRDGNLLIGCNSVSQCEKAQKLTSVGKVKVYKTVRVGERKTWGSRGVITGVPISVRMEEMRENLTVYNNTVKGVKRMTKGKEKKETETVLIEFEEQNIPKEVFYGFIRYGVREYIPNPIRCYKCQGFGHLAKKCEGKRRCARCGEDHEYGKCVEGVRPKCSNCGGGHSAAYWGCEVMQQEVKIQAIKVQEKVSYAEAVRRMGQKKSTDKEERGHGQVNHFVMEKVEERIHSEKKRMVTFIAGVINATAGVKSKTERIQIIVKAAIHHLGLREIKWEEVREELSAQASQEQLCVG